MPEGVEVKQLVESFGSEVEGLRIDGVAIRTGRYTRVDPMTMGLAHLPNSKIERVSYKGKLIVFHLDCDGTKRAILSTLGMTGWWEVTAPELVKRFQLDADSLAKHRRIDIDLSNGSKLSYYDPRNFGTFKVVEYSEMKRKLAELGPDILMEPRLWESIGLPEFIARARRFGRKLTLAEGLLDQRIACGCGNYIRADAMYLSGLAPQVYMANLSDADLRSIWISMSRVAGASLADLAVHPEIDESTGDAVRFSNLCYHRRTSRNGNTIESYKDKNGRTVWWCPAEQA